MAVTNLHETALPGVPIVVCGSMIVVKQIMQHVRNGTLYVHETFLRQLMLFVMALFFGYINLLMWPLRTANSIVFGDTKVAEQLRDPYHALNGTARALEKAVESDGMMKLRNKLSDFNPARMYATTKAKMT